MRTYVQVVMALAIPISIYLAYRVGLHRGRADGVSRLYATAAKQEAERRKRMEITGLSPVVRRAVIRPTSRTRSQVDMEDENG